MLGGGSDEGTIGQACRRGTACHRANLRVLRRQRLHTRAKQHRHKARSEISAGNDAARAANSGAVAARVSVLRRGVFCPGKGRGRSASGRMCRARFGGQSAIVPRSPKIASYHRKDREISQSTLRVPCPSRSPQGYDMQPPCWLKVSHRRRRPSSNLQVERTESEVSWQNQDVRSVSADRRPEMRIFCPRLFRIYGKMSEISPVGEPFCAGESASIEVQDCVHANSLELHSSGNRGYIVGS